MLSVLHLIHFCITKKSQNFSLTFYACIKSEIHFVLIFKYGMRYGSMFWFVFVVFPCEYPTVTASFVEKTSSLIAFAFAFLVWTLLDHDVLSFLYIAGFTLLYLFLDVFIYIIRGHWSAIRISVNIFVCFWYESNSYFMDKLKYINFSILWKTLYKVSIISLLSVDRIISEAIYI